MANQVSVSLLYQVKQLKSPIVSSLKHVLPRGCGEYGIVQQAVGEGPPESFAVCRRSDWHSSVEHQPPDAVEATSPSRCPPGTDLLLSPLQMAARVQANRPHEER